MSMTYEQIKDNETIQTYIAQADKSCGRDGGLYPVHHGP